MAASVPPYRVIFQLTADDPLVQKAFVRQVNNLLEALPGKVVEVVTHGGGLDVLLRTSTFADDLAQLQTRGLVFLTCRNTLTARKIDATALQPYTVIVPAAVAHLVVRQSEGRSYIKVS